MAKFQVVEVAEATRTGRWTVVEIVPGEKPVPVSFFRSKNAALAEARRLNLYGQGEAKSQKRRRSPS
jgi:hypothetical protein